MVGEYYRFRYAMRFMMRRTCLFLFCIVFLMLIAHPLYAQPFQTVPDRAESTTFPTRNGDEFSPIKPRSRAVSVVPFSISLDPVSREIKKDAIATVPPPGAPYQIGFGRDVPQLGSINDTTAHMQWQNTPKGGKIVAISILSQQATGVRLGILVRRLPTEATLRFYAQGAETGYEISGKEVMESIKRNLDAGDSSDAARTYWAPLVEGEEVTMEIELPAEISPDAVEIAIPRVSLFFLPSPVAAGGDVIKNIRDAASCEVDVSCYSDWDLESNATANMIFTGTDGQSHVCSGTLLNDTLSTFTPYFLSANHCISKQTVASTLLTYWFYRSTTCNSYALNPGYRIRIGGATLLYASSVTDTSFLRLSDTPPPGAVYAGWSASAPSVGTEVTGIHHPQGDFQKISFGSIQSFQDCTTSDPVTKTFSCIYSTEAAGDFLNITYTNGITESGSSGSGLFKTIGSSHYLIGQLRGNSSSCGNPNGANYYGRFDLAYNASLHQWLKASSTFSLSVSKPGNGNGTVTSSPSGINCGTTCSAPFDSGTGVMLTATPTPGSTFSGWSGACSGTGTSCFIVMNAATSVTATFEIPTISFGSALDNTNLAWTTGGNAFFTTQTSTSYYGGSAAQTGRIGDNQSTYLSTSVTGPGTLSFYWKVNSENDYDIFSVYLDGVRKFYWSGNSSWYKSEVNIPSGTHTVKWEYVKDSSYSSGQDAGWVDDVVFTPAIPSIRVITPNGGETWATGSTHAITWIASNLNQAGAIYVYYWYNNDWQKIAGPLLPSNTSCSWQVPNTPTASSYIWVGNQVNNAWEINDNSDQSFIITQTGSNTTLYFPHVDTTYGWQTEIAIINTSTSRSISGTLRALDNRGQLVETKAVTLPARGRRQIAVANEFTNHTSIGYIIFDADSDTVQGYTKFFIQEAYRAAIPAVKEVNSSDIYVTHIDSGAQWWTGVSLVNTTSAAKELTITFNTGETILYTLNANEHRAFTIASLFDDQPQPDIKSAVITNASGIIGLELFGTHDGKQLEGIPLTDNTASIIYYPHVDTNGWWTGIVAYNPSVSDSAITITPYDKDGAPFPPINDTILRGKNYVRVVSPQIGFPSQTAWFKIVSSRPLSGFELFGSADGNQLGAYAGGGSTGATSGVFAKIEKIGWTGIAFVNTEDTVASVTLTAYSDNGTAVATRVLSVNGHAKVVNLAEDIFLPQNISSATYIAFSSDKNVVGFQLNGTADWMMLDGLPGM